MDDSYPFYVIILFLQTWLHQFLNFEHFFNFAAYLHFRYRLNYGVLIMWVTQGIFRER